MSSVMTVRVPRGLRPGDLMTVRADGHEFSVCVPLGCGAGAMIEIDTTMCRPPSIDVELPIDAHEGDEMLVELDEGESFTFVVPNGSRPGSTISVELPNDDATEASGAGDVTETSGEWDSASELAAEPFLWPSLHHALKPQPEHQSPRPVRLGTRVETEFNVGEEVDVLRSDHTYTIGTIDATDPSSGTYTVRMNDGRIKWLVDEGDLRHLKAGAFRVGDKITATISPGSRGVPARIAGFDDDSGTYSVMVRASAETCAKLYCGIADDEIAGRAGEP